MAKGNDCGYLGLKWVLICDVLDQTLNIWKLYT